MARGRLRAIPLVFAALLCAALVAACGGGSSAASAPQDQGGGMAVGGGAASPGATAAAAPPAGAPTGGGGGGGGDNQAPAAADGSLIVKTGTLQLEVTDLGAAVARARTAIAGVGGYSAGSEESNGADRQVASITYRIPAARWDDAIAALRGLAARVVAEKTQASEVTAQVVDLGARLENLAASEQALQAIMTRAQKIPEILEVQRELTRVREEIERIAAQKSNLEQQAALGTLTVTWETPAIAKVETTAKGWDLGTEVDSAAGQALRLAQGLASVGLWFLFVGLPLLVVTVAVSALAVFLYRRFAPRRHPATGWTVPD